MLWIEKYRPASFDGIIAQDAVVNHLRLFAAEKTSPHLLLSGPAGTGKTVAIECLARGLYGDGWQVNTTVLDAAAIFAGGRKVLEEDDRFSHLYHKDEGLLANFKRVIRWYASLRPLDADFKLMAFEGAASLSFESQQALRRTMERYSPTCRFILTDRSSSGIIPAISSRCLPLYFTPIPPGLAASHLQSILRAETGSADTVPADDLDLIVQASRGDLRRAIMMLEVVVRTGGKADLADLSATETGSMVEALYAAIAGGNLAKARQLTQMLMITYGLSARELLVQLSDVFAREYHDPRVAVIVGDTDALLPNAGNEFIQVNAMLARVIAEVFS